MARANNNNVASSSSLTLTISHYAASARSVCYTLPEALQALCTKNTSVYVKLSSLGGLVDKSGNIPATMAMGSEGFTPLSYCAVDALDVPSKAEFASDDAFYDAVRTAMGGSATPAQQKQETITRPARTAKTPAAPMRVTGSRTPKNPATVTPPAQLVPAAQTTEPGNSRIDALENGLNTVTSQLATLLQALSPAKKAGK